MCVYVGSVCCYRELKSRVAVGWFFTRLTTFPGIIKVKQEGLERQSNLHAKLQGIREIPRIIIRFLQKPCFFFNCSDLYNFFLCKLILHSHVGRASGKITFLCRCGQFIQFVVNIFLRMTPTLIHIPLGGWQP